MLPLLPNSQLRGINRGKKKTGAVSFVEGLAFSWLAHHGLVYHSSVPKIAITSSALAQSCRPEGSGNNIPGPFFMREGEEAEQRKSRGSTSFVESGKDQHSFIASRPYWTLRAFQSPCQEAAQIPRAK